MTSIQINLFGEKVPEKEISTEISIEMPIEEISTEEDYPDKSLQPWVEYLIT